MRARKATRALTGALAFWLSCGLLASFAQMTKPAPPTPIDAKKAELGGKTWNPEWDHMLEQGIPEAMLSSQVPHDVRRFCLRFYSMSDTDKRVFWAYFFQALAGAEAGLNPDTRVRHRQPEVNKIDEVTHRPVRQEGLLQLTYQDKKAYGCDFDWERDRELKSDDPDKTILRPKNNLECGITILYNQIITHHKAIVTRSFVLVNPASRHSRISRVQKADDQSSHGMRVADATVAAEAADDRDRARAGAGERSGKIAVG